MKLSERLERRNSSMDILRIVAAFTVLSVHFFLHNGFYSEPVSGYGPIKGIGQFFATGDGSALHGPLMFLAVAMRTLFGVCVPLFMILTGYLMSKKELKKGYYKGIRKTVIIFVLATIACMIFKSVHGTPEALQAWNRGDFATMFDAIAQTRQYNFINFIFGTLDFTGANYSWYIEMYIGLFLLAPFLNLAYNKLETKKHKQILVVTMIAISVLPTLFNIFNFSSAEWWVTPTTSDEFQKLIPAYWLSIYPLTYYFVGAYLREYGVRLKTGTTAALLVGSLLGFTVFNWFRSYGGGFKTGSYGYWYGFSPFVLAVLLFILISRIKSENWKPGVKLALWKVSDLALGIYLCSYIFDEQIYETLRNAVPVMVDRIPYYLITVPLCFVLSALLSALLNWLAGLLVKLYEKIKEIVKEQMSRDDRRKWQDFLFIALMTFALLFSFWKCRYGFGGNDEPFYLTIPHRLTLGDALFSDEWHLSQLSGFLLLPFVALYRLITGSTDGIILAARVVYVLCHAGATVAIYSRLRKYGYITVCGCVLYFLYTPFNIMALSYDSMGVELLLLSGVLLATADYSKKLQLIFSGLALAGAVLCNPYLAVLYVLYAAGMGIHYLLKNKDVKLVFKSEMFTVRPFLFFTAGVAILAVLFLAFTLTRTGIGDIFNNLPLMMKDPEHPHYTFWQKLSSYWGSFYNMQPHFKYVLMGYGAMLLVMLIDRKRRLHRAVYLSLSCLGTGITLIQLLPGVTSTTYNSMMVPFLFLGITSYILCENKFRELFAAVFVGGIIYSFCIHYTSNQMIYCISMALTVTNVASFVFLSQLVREMRENEDNLTYAPAMRIVSFSLVGLMIGMQTGWQLTAKAYHAFWENGMDSLTTEITQGPASGIITTDVRVNTYNELYADLALYMTQEPNEILVMSETTWPYLALNDFGYGTYSAWLSGENDNTLLRLSEFYAINPGKEPKYILLPKSSKWDIQKVLNDAAAKGYQVAAETNVSYHLEKQD